jgi:hypothetical protein
MRNQAQRGVTMLVVLVLLSVMLLGGLALARLTDVGTLASGNTAFREASLQVSEVGLNTAFQRIRDDIVDEENNLGTWYFATMQATDAQGRPAVDFDAAPTIVVGNYTIAYVAERLCEGAMPVTEPLRQCLVKQIPQLESASAGVEKPDPPTSKQFRVTIRVDGPKDTRTWTQSLITRG